MATKKIINLSNLQKFLLKLNEKFALKKAMKGISEDAEGNIIIGEEGLVPTPNENSKGKFLRSDGEWALPSETAVYDSMTIEEGIAGVSEVDKVLNAKNLKQIVNSDGFLTSLDSSKLTGIINIENLPQGALERVLIVSSKEERLTLSETEVQLGDVVKESDTGLMYYVINTEKLNSEEGYTQFTAGTASSVPWSDLSNKPTIPTKTSDLTNDSGFANDSNVVHKSGVETIAGVKTFTSGPCVTNELTTAGYSVKNTAIARNDVPTQLYHATFRTYDKNDKILGEYCVEKSTTGCTLLNMNVRSEDSNGNQLSESVYLNMSNDGSAARFYPSSDNKVDLGMSNHKWAKVYSDDVVHTSGDETISGNKYFTQDVNVKNSDVDIAVTPSNNLFSWFRFRGKGNVTTASIQYSQRTYGVNDLCFYVFDADSNSHGFRIRTDNVLEPIANNTYSLGSSSNKWLKVHSDDVVHTSGNETIAGNKTFSDRTISNKELQYRDTKYDWSDTSINTWCDAGHVEWFDKTGNRRMHELVGANNGIWRKVCYINENQYFSVDNNRNIGYEGISFKFNGKNVAIDENLVHTTGNETISGTKTFSSKIVGNLQGNADTATKATQDSVGQQINTTYIKGLSVSGKTITYTRGDNTTGTITTQDTNTTYSKLSQFTNDCGFITSSGSCASASSATYATTQAISDNSTQIATTEWVTNKLPQLVMCIGSAINTSNGTIRGSSCYPVYQAEDGFQYNSTITLVDGTYKILSSCYPGYISGAALAAKYYFLVTRIA